MTRTSPKTANIVKHFRQATNDEKSLGLSWYADAHVITVALAEHTGVSVATMAGLISNYSPQNSWHRNLLTATNVARNGRGLGGEGSGIFASKHQAEIADRMLEGEHYSSLLSGLKIRAFASLLERGGQNGDLAVACDRHAYSVAIGRRCSDADYMASNLTRKKKLYEALAGMYAEAAKQISTKKQVWSAEQVQATTWLVRQRLNKEEEIEKRNTSKTQKQLQFATEKWQAYLTENGLDDLIVPATGW